MRLAQALSAGAARRVFRRGDRARDGRVRRGGAADVARVRSQGAVLRAVPRRGPGLRDGSERRARPRLRRGRLGNLAGRAVSEIPVAAALRRRALGRRLGESPRARRGAGARRGRRRRRRRVAVGGRVLSSGPRRCVLAAPRPRRARPGAWGGHGPRVVLPRESPGLRGRRDGSGSTRRTAPRQPGEERRVERRPRARVGRRPSRRLGGAAPGRASRARALRRRRPRGLRVRLARRRTFSQDGRGALVRGAPARGAPRGERAPDRARRVPPRAGQI
mmetsp:Transcript_27175/g.83724  ORF Transcript_27175/g.83724 Transcript_27175/m.83724 type:complete len:276 (+) Transcript_27175:1081-1908(+)